MASHSRSGKKTFRPTSDLVLSTGRRPQIGTDTRTHAEPAERRSRASRRTRSARTSVHSARRRLGASEAGRRGGTRPCPTCSARPGGVIWLPGRAVTAPDPVPNVTIGVRFSAHDFWHVSPGSAVPKVAWAAWAAEGGGACRARRTSGSAPSCARDESEPIQESSGSPPTESAGCPGYGARRWRRWPVSARRTTPGSSRTP